MKQDVSNFTTFVEASHFVLFPGGLGSSLPLYGFTLKSGTWSGEANLVCENVVKTAHQAFLCTRNACGDDQYLSRAPRYCR